MKNYFKTYNTNKEYYNNNKVKSLFYNAEYYKKNKEDINEKRRLK